LRKKVWGDGRDHAYSEGAGDRVFALDDISSGGFEFAQNRPRAWEECFADIGETNRATQTIEKSCAEFVFQLEDLLREGRLRDVRMLRGAAE
jgi:hypothetical protein